MRLIYFGDFVTNYYLPLWNRRDNISTGDAGGSVVTLISGSGYDHHGGGQVFEGPTTVSASWEIIATTATAVQTERDAIRAMLGKQNYLIAQPPDGSLRFARARLSRLRMERRIEYIYHQPVEATWEIAISGWREVGQGYNLDAGHALDTGLLLDHNGDTWDLTSGEETLVLPLGGNRMVTDVYLTFTVPAGTASINEIRLQCGPCDWTWKETLAGPITPGVLAINCGTKSVIHNGSNAYDTLTLGAGHTVADWLQLQPGDNTVTVTYAGSPAAAIVTVAYLDAWI